MQINKSNIFRSLALIALLLASSSQIARAAITNPVIGDLGVAEGVENGGKFIGYTVYLWRTSISLGALAVIGYFLWGAFEWITAGSDSKKTESARSRMTNAIIGLVLMVTSFTLLGFISKVLFGDNFDLMRLTFPTMNQEAAATPPAAGSAGSNNGPGTFSGINAQ
jgi:hypothetical protein